MHRLERTHGVESLRVLAFEQVNLVLCILDFDSEAMLELAEKVQLAVEGGAVDPEAGADRWKVDVGVHVCGPCGD
jgi:hypothetical protein